MRIHRSMVILTATVATFTVAGCGTEKFDDSPAGRTQAGAPTASLPSTRQAPSPEVLKGPLKGLELPLEKYMVSFSDSLTEQKAKVAHQKTCIAAFGVSYAPPEPGAYPPPSDNVMNIERRYGISNEEDAGEIGYGVPEDSGEPPVEADPPAAVEQLLQGRDAKGKELLKRNGRTIPSGGCEGEAERIVGGQQDGLAGELAGQSYTQSMASSDVRESFEKWSACMALKGYNFANPTQIESGGTEMAMHDFACKDKANLLKVWFSREAEIQRGMIESNSEALRSLKRQNTKVLASARGEL